MSVLNTALSQGATAGIAFFETIPLMTVMSGRLASAVGAGSLYGSMASATSVAGQYVVGRLEKHNLFVNKIASYTDAVFATINSLALVSSIGLFLEKVSRHYMVHPNRPEASTWFKMQGVLVRAPVYYALVVGGGYLAHRLVSLLNERCDSQERVQQLELPRGCEVDTARPGSDLFHQNVLLGRAALALFGAFTAVGTVNRVLAVASAVFATLNVVELARREWTSVTLPEEPRNILISTSEPGDKQKHLRAVRVSFRMLHCRPYPSDEPSDDECNICLDKLSQGSADANKVSFCCENNHKLHDHCMIETAARSSESFVHSYGQVHPGLEGVAHVNRSVAGDVERSVGYEKRGGQRTLCEYYSLEIRPWGIHTCAITSCQQVPRLTFSAKVHVGDTRRNPYSVDGGPDWLPPLQGEYVSKPATVRLLRPTTPAPTE